MMNMKKNSSIKEIHFPASEIGVERGRQIDDALKSNNSLQNIYLYNIGGGRSSIDS
jgi:hypothetical protein